MTYIVSKHRSMRVSHGVWGGMIVGTFVGVGFLLHTTATAFFLQTTSASGSLPEVPGENLQTIPLLRAAIHSDPNPAKSDADIVIENGALIPSGSPVAITDDANTSSGEISIYVVHSGDTISEIAEMFDVSVKTILWANNLTNVNQIHPGDSLVILPITGVRHIVKSGDTVQSIAKKYGGDVDDIIAYNQLDGTSSLTVGDTIVIPDGTIATPAPAKSSSSKKSSSAKRTAGGSGYFTNPVPGSVETQGIHGYNGVDLAAPAGTPIHAAADGTVIIVHTSGYNGGYGLYVAIKHSNGTQTLYAHMSRVAATVGEKVSQGEVIGYVGSTGRSTGNHVHFEVRGGVNPF